MSTVTDWTSQVPWSICVSALHKLHREHRAHGRARVTMITRWRARVERSTSFGTKESSLCP
eukprot:575198-Pyramimonas_sp.AAC.1